MTKKAPFFSHDMNARNDPKISAMRGVYGAEGYGRFWTLVEMMAESDGYQLDIKSKYAFNAYALQVQCKPEEMQRFIEDCITEFELFNTDGTYFWSNSLRKRMQYRDAVSEKKAAAAAKRWENSKSNADADAYASKNDADAMQKNANKTKQNETKQNIDNGVSVHSLLAKYNVKCKGVFELEKVESFAGMVDPEVLEHAVKISEGKGVPYVETVLNRLIEEGKTSAESVASNKSRGFNQKAARQAPNYVMREFTDEELQNLPRG